MADCRYVSNPVTLEFVQPVSSFETLHTRAIGATAGDLPAQLHASYTAYNAEWRLAAPLLARNYKQTLVRMEIIDQRGVVCWLLSRGMRDPCLIASAAIFPRIRAGCFHKVFHGGDAF